MRPASVASSRTSFGLNGISIDMNICTRIFEVIVSNVCACSCKTISAEVRDSSDAEQDDLGNWQCIDDMCIPEYL